MAKMLIYGGIINVIFTWYGICAQIERKQTSAFTLSLPPEHISVKFRTLNLHHIYFSCKAAQICFFVQCQLGVVTRPETLQWSHLVVGSVC